MFLELPLFLFVVAPSLHEVEDEQVHEQHQDVEGQGRGDGLNVVVVHDVVPKGLIAGRFRGRFSHHGLCQGWVAERVTLLLVKLDEEQGVRLRGGYWDVQGSQRGQEVGVRGVRRVPGWRDGGLSV